MMIDWIKYFPLKLRYLDHPCAKKGPSFKPAKLLKCTVEGSEITFSAPRHNSQYSSIKPLHHRVTRSAGEWLRSFNHGVMGNKKWEYHTIFVRNWAFWGAWFSGSQANLHTGVSIIGRREEDEYSDISFFHPKAFEKVIVDYLNDRYGYDRTSNGQPRYQGPLSWQSKKIGGVFAAIFKIQQVYMGELEKDAEYRMFFPITEKHFISVGLSPGVYGSEDKNDPTPVYELAEAIINSFSVKLSAEKQVQVDAIAAQCPDMMLTKIFAPLKWPTAITGEGDESVSETEKEVAEGCDNVSFLEVKRK